MQNELSTEKVISPFLAVLVLLLEGSASIAIQFLVLRQIVPFVGNSILVTSIVVSVFLGALALGYKKGGEVIHGHSLRLSNNLLRAAIFFGIFFSYLFLYMMFQHVYSGLNPFVAITVHSLVFMFYPVYLIGQTVPLLVSFLSPQVVSEKTGNALLYSTLGNAVGGIAISGIAIYFWGVSAAIVIASTILIFVSFIVADKIRKAAVVGLGFLGFFVVYGLNVPAASYFFSKETHYANYQVIDAKDGAVLMANNAFMSAHNKKSKQGFPYIQHAKNTIKGYFGEGKLKNLNILVIGSGGFTFNYDNMFDPKRVTYVDIDSQIKKIVEEDFLKAPVREKFVAQDGRSYLSSVEKTYDVIFIDAFTHRINIPQSMTSAEFYSLVKSRLKPDGISVANIVTEPFITEGWSARIDNTLNYAFNGQCSRSVVAFTGGNDSANVLYACRKEGNRAEDTYYKDDKNNSNIDISIGG